MKHGLKFYLKDNTSVGYKFLLLVENDTAPNIKVEIEIELCRVELKENISLQASDLTYIHIIK